MTLSDIINAYPALEKISKATDLPTSTKYRIALILSKAIPSINFFDEQKMILWEKYGTINENNEKIIPTNNVQKFTEELNTLCKTETDEFTTKCDISCLTDLPVTAEEIMTLMPFFNFVD